MRLDLSKQGQSSHKTRTSKKVNLTSTGHSGIGYSQDPDQQFLFDSIQGIRPVNRIDLIKEKLGIINDVRGRELKYYEHLEVLFLDRIKETFLELKMPPHLIDELAMDTLQYYILQNLQAQYKIPPDRKYFQALLKYDLENKSFSGSSLHTLQEQYMTWEGWIRRSTRPEPTIEIFPDAPILVFRTMNIKEWYDLKRLKALTFRREDGSCNRGGHFGDFREAARYLRGETAESVKVMVEFPIKADKVPHLFSPQIIGLPQGPGKKGMETTDTQNKLPIMINALEKDGFGGNYPSVEGAQGYSATSIGIKMEDEGEAGFSFAITTNVGPSFLNLVTRSKIGVRAFKKKGSPAVFLQTKEPNFDVL